MTRQATTGVITSGAILLISGWMVAGGWNGRDAADAASAEAPLDPAAAISSPPEYRFDEPDAAFELPESLYEISGLTVLPGGRLGAVQDEEGVLYILDPASGTVRGFSQFGNDGDYEGVETAGHSIFILRSDGMLFELSGWGGARLDVRAIRTGLDEDNDPEGLAYDAAGNRLLIACKEDPGGGLDAGERAVYAFDLLSGKLIEDPVFEVNIDDVEDSLDDDGFKPSAIAVHPATGDVYVLSSKPSALAVLDAGGRLKGAERLSNDLFEQPEGLAFAEDGTLFLSSEGVDDPAMIFRFSPR